MGQPSGEPGLSSDPDIKLPLPPAPPLNFPAAYLPLFTLKHRDQLTRSVNLASVAGACTDIQIRMNPHTDVSYIRTNRSLFQDTTQHA